MDSWYAGMLQLLGKDNFSFYKKVLLKRGFTVLVIQFCGLAIAFASNILLARMYGGRVYGIYALVTSWCMLLSILGLFGMDDSHLVNLPAWKLQDEKIKIRGQLKWSLGINLISITIISAAFYFTLHFFELPGLSKYARYFHYGLLLIFFLALMNNLLSFLRGMDKVVYGEIIDKIVRPCFLVVLFLVFYFLTKTDLVLDAITANIVGLFCILLLLLIKIRQIIGRQKATGDKSKNNYSLMPNFRYVLLNLLYFLSTRMDLLLLGLFSNAVSVGHYNVAAKFSDISSYPVAIINLLLPTMLSAEKYKKGDAAGAFLLYRISKNSFFQCLLLSCLFMLTGNWILRCYGREFTGAFPVLLVFLTSNLISSFIGSADVFFIMEGMEKKPLYSRIFSLLLTLTLSFFFIPKWQLMGAAVSMLLGNFLYCILMEYFFFLQYGFFIHPFASTGKLDLPHQKRKRITG